MATSRKRTTGRAWLPAPAKVVSITSFVPTQRPPAARAALAAPPAYRILRTTEVDPYDKAIPRAAVMALGVTAAAPPSDNFAGTARKAAKLSIAKAPVEQFDDVKDLIATLPADKTMINHKPKIKVNAKSDRVDEEKRNVRVSVFLYAASREDDNDFHMIIGRKPGLSLMFMTAELSALPPKSSKSFGKLKKTRDTYKDFFKTNLPHGTYDFYDPPIPVEIEGSLFFDMSHAKGGHPGPSKLRPNIPTIWEIHPVTNIVFEPST